MSYRVCELFGETISNIHPLHMYCILDIYYFIVLCNRCIVLLYNTCNPVLFVYLFQMTRCGIVSSSFVP